MRSCPYRYYETNGYVTKSKGGESKGSGKSEGSKSSFQSVLADIDEIDGVDGEGSQGQQPGGEGSGRAEDF